jgi:hypothetical protein
MTTKRTARTRSKKSPTTIRLSEVKAEDLKRIMGGNGSENGGLQGTCGSERNGCP